jgi:hypothetical protein
VSLLLATPITITHPEAEDSSGVAGSTVYNVKGMVIAITEAQRATMFGDVPAGAVSIFLDPAGFRDTDPPAGVEYWNVEAGDMLTDGLITVKVGSVTPVSNPRTGELKIVEASGGVS